MRYGVFPVWHVSSGVRDRAGAYVFCFRKEVPCDSRYPHRLPAAYCLVRNGSGQGGIGFPEEIYGSPCNPDRGMMVAHYD